MVFEAHSWDLGLLNRLIRLKGGCFSAREKASGSELATLRRWGSLNGEGWATMAKDAKQKHVLVVNDTPEILDMFQMLLGDEGFRVSVDRFTVEMAVMLSRVKNIEPDLIVLDYLIGREESGWQFLQMLKMDRETKDLPVVICTAATQQVDQIRAHLDEMGVGVILKPFDIDHLLEVIKSALAGFPA